MLAGHEGERCKHHKWENDICKRCGEGKPLLGENLRRGVVVKPPQSVCRRPVFVRRGCIPQAIY